MIKNNPDGRTCEKSRGGGGEVDQWGHVEWEPFELGSWMEGQTTQNIMPRAQALKKIMTRGLIVFFMIFLNF